MPRLPSGSVLWVLVTLPLLSGIARAGDISVPVNLDLALVTQALQQQLFVGPDGRAEVFSDGLNCNSLTLSDPRVEGTEEGRLRLVSRVQARIGTPVGGRCLMPLSWGGVIETEEEVTLLPGSATLSFRVMDSNVLRADEEGRALPGTVWSWVKHHVHPQLSAVTVNLSPAMLALQGLLREAVPASAEQRFAVADSLHISGVDASPDGLQVTFAMQVPEVLAQGFTEESQAAFDSDELARWDQSWQAWEGFATWLIVTLAEPAGPSLRDALMDILFDARHQLRDALVQQQAGSDGQDPVHALFLSTWSRLAPLLGDAGNRQFLPGADLLQMAAFISAADALHALDQAAPHLGITIDQHTLRALARMLVPAVSDEQLAYDTSVDPRLRELLGLPPVFDESPASPLPFLWVVPRAEASLIDNNLVKSLTGWVPQRGELDEYLEAMDRLLDASIRVEKERGKVPVEFMPIYENLVRATAWQESCWRQYVTRNGQVQPIQSPAGAVGLMQINKHVWRGVYDLEGLHDNVAYNARAGSEIITHYLVDYAIKRGEHNVTGNPEDLARATYAIYNGGPRQLSRYRNPDASRTLKAIDSAFWKKYVAIREQGADAVRSCYGG